MEIDDLSNDFPDLEARSHKRVRIDTGLAMLETYNLASMPNVLQSGSYDPVRDVFQNDTNYADYNIFNADNNNQPYSYDWLLPAIPESGESFVFEESPFMDIDRSSSVQIQDDDSILFNYERSGSPSDASDANQEMGTNELTPVVGIDVNQREEIQIEDRFSCFGMVCKYCNSLPS